MSRRKKRVCVVGLGHFGKELALALAETCEVLAIDRDQEVINDISEHVDRALVVDILDEEALASVIPEDIDEAVVGMGESLEASILCTLYLKRLEVPFVRVKALSDDHATVLRRIGADEMVFPEREAARRVAAHIVNPNLLDYVPVGADHQVLQVQAPDSFRFRTLADLGLRARYDVFVIAVNRLDPEATYFMPGPDFRLEADDVLVVLGRERDLLKFRRKEAVRE